MYWPRERTQEGRRGVARCHSAAAAKPRDRAACRLAAACHTCVASTRRSRRHPTPAQVPLTTPKQHHSHTSTRQHSRPTFSVTQPRDVRAHGTRCGAARGDSQKRAHPYDLFTNNFISYGAARRRGTSVAQVLGRRCSTDTGPRRLISPLPVEMRAVIFVIAAGLLCACVPGAAATPTMDLVMNKAADE